MKTLELSDLEMTLLFYLCGYGREHLPEIYNQQYNTLIKKMLEEK